MTSSCDDTMSSPKPIVSFHQEDPVSISQAEYTMPFIVSVSFSIYDWARPPHPTIEDIDGVIKWNHFPHYWRVVRGIHQSPVNSPHKGQWRGALMSSLICAWIKGWVNNDEAVDLRHHRAHYDVTIMRYIYDVFSHCMKTCPVLDRNFLLSPPAYDVMICRTFIRQEWQYLGLVERGQSRGVQQGCPVSRKAVFRI